MYWSKDDSKFNPTRWRMIPYGRRISQIQFNTTLLFLLSNTTTTTTRISHQFFPPENSQIYLENQAEYQTKNVDDQRHKSHNWRIGLFRFLRRFPRGRPALRSLLPHASRDRQLRLHIETVRFAMQKRWQALVLYVRPQVGLQDPDQEMGKWENHLQNSLPDPQRLGKSDWILAPRRHRDISTVDLLRVGPVVHDRVPGLSSQGRYIRCRKGTLFVDDSFAGGPSCELSRPGRPDRDFGRFR